MSGTTMPPLAPPELVAPALGVAAVVGTDVVVEVVDDVVVVARVEELDVVASVTG